MMYAARLSLTAALSLSVLLLAVASLTTGNAGAVHLPVEVAIDVDVAGNADNSLGPTESCNTTRIDVGDTFEIDIVLKGIPPAEQIAGPPIPRYRDGIAAFGLDLLFDEDVLEVDEVYEFNGPTILAADGLPIPFVVLSEERGRVRIDMLDLTTTYESGNGIATRIRMRAIAKGVSGLALADAFGGGNDNLPDVVSADSLAYPVNVSGATMHVGESQCGSLPSVTPPRSATPTATPQPTPDTPTPTPFMGAADIRVAVDTDVSGNADNALGTTEPCNVDPLDVGGKISIDIVVRGVPPYSSGQLLSGIIGYGFELGFDPSVLRIDRVLAFEGPSIVKAEGNFVRAGATDYDASDIDVDGAPGTSGRVRVEFFDTTHNYEHGDGVLTRVVLSAVGAGVSPLMVTGTFPGANVAVLTPVGDYPEVTVSYGSIRVETEACQAPSATPSPTPLPTPKSLPDTGEVPPSDSWSESLALIVIGGMLALAGGYIVARRRS